MLLETIKTLCKQKGISVTELERILEFGNGAMNKWERSQPSIDRVIKVADYFGLSVDDLVRPGKNIPSKETVEFANEYEMLHDDQKNLVRCYLSILKSGIQLQATCTTHSS